MTFCKVVYRDGDRVRVFYGEVRIDGAWVVISKPGYEDIRLNQSVVDAIVPTTPRDRREGL